MAGCRSPKPCGVGSSPTRDAKFSVCNVKGRRPGSEPGGWDIVIPQTDQVTLIRLVWYGTSFGTKNNGGSNPPWETHSGFH